jgi:integrase
VRCLPNWNCGTGPLVLPDAGTGLRVGELLGLKWQDVNFENLELHVRRSVVHQVIGRCKTEASAKPVPLDSFMSHDLLSWQRSSEECTVIFGAQ